MKISASFRLLLAAAGIACATGCGSNSNGNPDAAIPSGPDSAVPVPGLDGSAVPVPSLDGSASAEAAQPQEAGTATPSYCTNKPALPNVTNVSGTWAIRALATQVVNAPSVGLLHPKTLFYMLVNLTQSGTDIVADGRYCDRAEIDQPGSLVTVVVPDKWAHTEKPVRRPGQLVVGADGVSVLSFPLLVELAGAVPDATTDQLPTSVSDPHVIDEDNDGHPGITVNLTGMLLGSLYSVQRQTTAIIAIPVAPDRFEGVLDFASKQNVLDSYPTSLTALYGQAVAYSDPSECSSTFAMVKVADATNVAPLDASTLDASDGSPPSCAWLRDNEAVLFPQ